MRIAAILVAAGSGTRFGAETPKQFLMLAGKPVIRHAAEALATHVSLLQPVGEAAPIEAALQGIGGCLPVVPGGTTRQDSVRAGLEALVPHQPDVVLVHDAARPCIPPGTIPALLAALKEFPGAIPAVAVADTLKRVVRGVITATVPRDGLFRAQTPQAFHFAALLAAHRSGLTAATDDAALLEAAGKTVQIVAGSEDNIKLTYPEDLVRLERIMAVPRAVPASDPRAWPGDHWSAGLGPVLTCMSCKPAAGCFCAGWKSRMTGASPGTPTRTWASTRCATRSTARWPRATSGVISRPRRLPGKTPTAPGS